MFCSTGIELYENYQSAESAKNAFASRTLVAVEGAYVSKREIHQAKQRYVEHFANWLSHKAFCHECKPQAPSKGNQRSIEPGR